ncbi:MAG TPA: hypothetical protein DIW43_04340 [Spongiibacteraceae bacterium]|nr:hypothetical protein [Spongiibacteraceae bacterium]HCS26657.1 hypothetical protein [Spongiibacteraceae bacterium]|tara:strand:+ start:1151 stop:2002 length:852 start_codon:yes stop_codon:yes gene_type:complete
MRTLAEFIMRGRTQAVAVSVLSVGTVFFAWIGAAAIALVTLRKGASQGGYVLIWALLPAAVIALGASDLGPITAIVGVYLGASCLRATGSWPVALAVISVAGLGLAVLMNTVAVAQTQQIADLLSQVITQMRSQNPELALQAMSVADVAGLIGVINAYTVALSLLLGRWWQAQLYQPGGLRSEFHAMRLDRALVVALVVGMLLLGASESWRNWMLVLQMPLTFAGIGLVHAIVDRYRLAQSWLVVFYVLWVFLMPLRWLVQMLAVIDSFIDVRKRLPAPKVGE